VILAATGPDGRLAGAMRRPSERVNLSGRVEHALSASHTVRAEIQHTANAGRRLGVGDFDLPSRAYSRRETERVLRLSDYEAGRPSVFTMRRGNPRVSYETFQGAWYVQDDIRLRKNLTVSAGLRHEWQDHVGRVWNVAPRAGAAWSPFENGRTTFRGGAGIFFDWYEAETYEQTVQLDGHHLEDVTIVRVRAPRPPPRAARHRRRTPPPPWATLRRRRRRRTRR
jgi:hypothetical protein